MGKLQYGIEQAHIAVAKKINTIPYQYDNIIAIPGAVSLSLQTQSEIDYITNSKDQKIPVAVNDSGYQGTIEFINVPFSFLQQIFEYSMSDTGVISENQNTHINHFAFLFQFKNDSEARRCVFYNCVAKKADIGFTTISNKVNTKNQSYNITVLPRLDGKVKSCTSENNYTTDLKQYFDGSIEGRSHEIYVNWFNTDYLNIDYQI